jgi:hypothetical protein
MARRRRLYPHERRGGVVVVAKAMAFAAVAWACLSEGERERRAGIDAVWQSGTSVVWA